VDRQRPGVGDPAAATKAKVWETVLRESQVPSLRMPTDDGEVSYGGPRPDGQAGEGQVARAETEDLGSSRRHRTSVEPAHRA